MLRITLLFISLLANSAFADMTQNDLQTVLAQRIDAIKFMGKNSLLLSAVRDQNSNPLSTNEILKIDQEWRAGTSPMIQKVLNNRASKYLKHFIDQTSNTYSEVFVTDNMGANVAMYPTTSDFWQGDEESFINAWANGSGAVFIGKITEDESTQSTAVQISVPVIGPEKVEGVLVIGVKLSAIEAQKLRDLKNQGR